jgi:hypothetical protein
MDAPLCLWTVSHIRHQTSQWEYEATRGVGTLRPLNPHHQPSVAREV